MSKLEKKQTLIWIDLEMTGLIPETDRIIEIATLVAETTRLTWETVGKQDFERLMLELQSEKKELAQDRADFVAEMQSLLCQIEATVRGSRTKSKKMKWQRKDEVA